MQGCRNFTAVSIVMFVVLAMMLSGCGRDDSANAGPESGEAAEPEASVEKPSKVQGPIPAPMQAFEDDGKVAELTLEGNDLMQFDKKSLTVRAGQMVRLTLKHVGQLPAQAMGHNVVILQQGEVVFEFGADVGEAGGSPDDNYLPASVRNRVIAFTKIIGGGETTTVEFQAPQEAGDYPYLCSFPGHFAQMNGVMKVEP